MNRRKAIGKAMAKEEFLADGTTSTEPSGKKINPKGVDNYKSGAVQIAPVDEADPQNGYGVKEEVEKKDNRANYAYINFMKNKLRAGMGIKNPMVMVDPDKAKEKFEKMATSITASTGEEEEKEGACESVQTPVNEKMNSVSGRDTVNEPGALKVYRNVRTVGNLIPAIGKSLLGDKNAFKNMEKKEVERYKNPKGIERVATGIADKLTGDKFDFDKRGPSKKISTMNSSYDPISNKGILGISEKILKKNFNLGEEGYDIARDEGRVKPSKDKKDATTMPPSKEMEKTRKNYIGPSALEIVKKRYGKSVMNLDKKKKDEK